jgi:wyosine [tRNA(Phe)-imidazoG37] synthetase (radical SAM superfamily)
MSPSNLEGKEYYIQLPEFTTIENENIYERIRTEIENYSDSSSYAKKLNYLTSLRIEIKNPTMVGASGYTIKI